MRRHTPPHCTKKEQQGGVHLLTVSKGKWKGWRGGENNKLPLKSLRFVDVSNMKNMPRLGAFFMFKGGRWDGQGEGGREHVKHACWCVLHVWWMGWVGGARWGLLVGERTPLRLAF